MEGKKKRVIVLHRLEAMSLQRLNVWLFYSFTLSLSIDGRGGSMKWSFWRTHYWFLPGIPDLDTNRLESSLLNKQASPNTAEAVKKKRQDWVDSSGGGQCTEVEPDMQCMLGTQMSLEKSNGTSIRRAAVTATAKTMSQTVKPERAEPDRYRWRTYRFIKCAASETVLMLLHDWIFRGRNLTLLWNLCSPNLMRTKTSPWPPSAMSCPSTSTTVYTPPHTWLFCTAAPRSWPWNHQCIKNR